MRVAIVDDDEMWRNLTFETVRPYLDSLDEIEMFNSGVEFLEKNKEYDVVLMDIEMPHMDGFDTTLNYKSEYPDSIILILTTHLDCARKGYLVDAFRYIDKVKIEDELDEAFEKIREINEKNRTSLIGKSGYITKEILIKDILYIETNGRTTLINTLRGQYQCKEKINSLEKKLEKYGFFQCHKSFLINLNAVMYLDKEFAYFSKNKKAYISVRKYVETKRKYISIKKKYASM